ncbi:MAG: hypothetical protein C0620_06650 [Desulfuromonas sp.]|nr:MAG: hypothetical protein C0620_06650 [Desulfuromonas sp.]
MKTLVKLFIVLLIVIAAVVGAATYYLDSIAKKAVEYGGEKALGVPTKVDKLHISLLGGSTELGGFTIANPQGYSQQQFMTLDSAEVAINLNSLTSETIRISKVALSGLHLTIEQLDQSSNVQALLKNVPKSASGGDATTPSKSESTSASGKKFVIEQLTLDDINVSAQLSALGSQLSQVSLTVPPIHLTNVGEKNGGMTMEQLITFIVNTVIEATAKNSNSLAPALSQLLKADMASLDTLKGNASQAVSEKIDQVRQDALKDLQLPQGSDEQLKETTDNLLKGLLNK